ncbi:MAG: TolC family protein, partial [Bdellovibrionales bacterium]|nr:TolC family protein [Bdellovibrionales bacterium]
SFLVFYSPASFSFTLKELYEVSLQNSEAIRVKKLDVEIARKTHSQVFSAILPTLSLSSTKTIREASSSAGAFGETEQTNSSIELSQTLFKGGAEYFSLPASRQSIKVSELNLKAYEIQYYDDLSSKFFNTLKLRQEINIIQRQINNLLQQVTTLKNRARIGKNRQTDVLAAQTQLARTVAESSQIKLQLQLAENDLRQYCALNNISELIDNNTVDSLKINSAWEQKILKSPNIEALEVQIEISDDQLAVARSSFLPSLKLDGNYYLQRSGILKDSDWDITLSAEWNLFNGGYDQAEKKKKLYEKNQYELKLSQLRRQKQIEFESTLTNFQQNIEIVKQLDHAVQLSKKNYEQHKKDMNQGLVNQLDVLRVLQDYLQTERTYNQYYFTTKYTWHKLKALAGETL